MVQCGKISLTVLFTLSVAYQIGNVDGTSCKALNDTSCDQDSDCCSNYCYKPPGYTTGFCNKRKKTASEENSGHNITHQFLEGLQNQDYTSIIRITPTIAPTDFTRSGKVKSYPWQAIGGGHPWQVMIWRLEGTEWVPRCSGALVTERWVVTSAHCIDNHESADFRVRIGVWNTTTTMLSYEDYGLEVAKVHPGYRNETPSLNDIAVMKLYWNVNITPYTFPIPVTDIGKNTVITGMDENETVLKEAEVDIIPFDKCRKLFESERDLSDGHFCAGYQGAPDGLLTTFVYGIAALIGIPSKDYRVNSGPERYPGVYTNVSFYFQWIDEEIKRGNMYSVN